MKVQLRYTLVDEDLIYLIIDMSTENNDWVNLFFRTVGHSPSELLFQPVEEITADSKSHIRDIFTVTCMYLTLQDCRAVAKDSETKTGGEHIVCTV